MDGLMILLDGVYVQPDGETCDVVSDFCNPMIRCTYYVGLIRDLMLAGF